MLIAKLSSNHLNSPVSAADAKLRFGGDSARLTPGAETYRVITITAVEPERSVWEKLNHVWNRMWSVPENEPVVYRLPNYSTLA